MAVYGEKHHNPAMINEAFRLRMDEHMPIRAISEIVGIPRSTLGEYLLGQGESFHEFPCKQCGREMFAQVSTKIFCSHRCKGMWYYRNSEKYRETRRRLNREYKARKRARAA
jgi:hypothetical protein